MDRRCLRSPHDVEGNGLVGVAAQATDFEIEITGVDRVTQRGRWLCRSLKTEHALVPRLDGEPIGFLARLPMPVNDGRVEALECTVVLDFVKPIRRHAAGAGLL